MKEILKNESDDLNKKIIQWSSQYLLSIGYKLKSTRPISIQNTPWSYVARFDTSDGYIYLKHTPKHLALEATIIQILHDKFHASVPDVIVHNSQLNCFLMKDAGQTLREILKNKFDVELFCKVINQFTSLQLATSDNLDIFLNIGVPNWRLDKLPDLYKELVSQKDLLIEDGLSEIEINKLETLLPMVVRLCDKLSIYPIKQTIVQPDFNDNNTLVNSLSQKITTIDLGEIVISHPFFSLINCLQQIQKHHGITVKDDAYTSIMDACLKNRLNVESKENLLEAFESASILWLIYDALSRYRLINACDKEKLMGFQHGRISDSLKKFINVYITI
ncbi:MAG: aminoglycoside phosphotransferase family protein [Legionellaceae bacterium]|nr:aminoglycoside phosphotransferase family protein [Legionellaceae bacterium]